ncbi:PTS sugar transporter subunit IIA [Calorimonas adulescens]|jgi:Phosphoenolpyruvate-dependent sugar phosphotransferase system, EIIA 2.|nr:PTS sugar transporter subunit IIA [Calorimonas adulescens]
MIKDFIREDLILNPLVANSSDEALKIISDLLYSKKYVKDSFYTALIEREKHFPTGLLIDGINVAIPHTDCVHVINPCIGVGVLQKPINFKNMGNPTEDVAVDIIFVLALNEPHGQIELLRQLMTLFQDRELLESIKSAKNSTETYNVITSFESVI